MRAINAIRKKNYLCPYCLDDLSAFDIKECCDKNPNHVLKGFALRDRLCREPGCGGHYTQIKCAKCGHILPYGFNQFDSYIRFALIGPSSAGKSTYLTVMMKELKNSRMGFVCSPVGSTKAIYEANVSKMYTDHLPLPPTPPGTVIPQLWEIRDSTRVGRTTVPTSFMTIFDGAGEDLDKDVLDPVICRYVAKSRMLFLLLDPTRIENVARNMDRDTLDRTRGSGKYVPNSSVGIIYPLVDYIRRLTHTKPGVLVSTPVAVVFGKLDSVKEKFGNATVLQPSGHVARRKFDLGEANMVHEEIEGWLKRLGEQELTKLLNANFQTWHYFGTSSLGAVANADGTLAPIRPLRVLDPLIWAMTLEGVLR